MSPCVQHLSAMTVLLDGKMHLSPQKKANGSASPLVGLHRLDWEGHHVGRRGFQAAGSVKAHVRRQKRKWHFPRLLPFSLPIHNRLTNSLGFIPSILLTSSAPGTEKLGGTPPDPAAQGVFLARDPRGTGFFFPSIAFTHRCFLSSCSASHWGFHGIS